MCCLAVTAHPRPEHCARSPARRAATAAARQTRAVSPARRTELVVLLVIYVVPLTAALVLLVVAGLGQLALALAVVEAVVIAAVVWAKRTSP